MEYKIVWEDLSNSELNQLGAIGWELVTIVYDVNDIKFYFKRKIYYPPIAPD